MVLSQESCWVYEMAAVCLYATFWVSEVVVRASQKEMQAEDLVMGALSRDSMLLLLRGRGG